ncbi:MAG: Uma2 family endonuclease [Cyanobacteria bacterium P01_D01_bin.1]
MVQTPTKPITLAAFLALPETKPASEFIDGKITQKPMPKGKHSRLQTKLSNVLNDSLEPQHTGLAFTGLRCSFGGAAVVPDVLVLSSDRITRDQDGDIADIVEIAPDLIIEILSPQQSSTKVIKKISHCLNHASQLGWLIEPKERTVLVFRSNQAVEILEAPTAQLPMPNVLDKFGLTVETLFGWLQV